ncbi:hypothetical protein C8R43DRAFT_1116785 [Mycena crocata]|nr:hypothetical protein C8R43DRAFT_1116785 [Mycena crocata]
MFNRRWFLLVVVPASFISHAGATLSGPNGTVDNQFETHYPTQTRDTAFDRTVDHLARDDGEGPVYYAAFCGIDLRDSMTNVHNECDNIVLEKNPTTNIPIYTKVHFKPLVCIKFDGAYSVLQITEQRPTNHPQSSTECDHYLELQIVNSIAMAPVDRAPFGNNGACSAINAMLDVMKGKFPTGQSYAEIKTSFIRESPLFTLTNLSPITYWINSHFLQKGKLIRRFLTVRPPNQIMALSPKDRDILPALKSYIRDFQIKRDRLELVEDLEAAWQPLIDRFYNKISDLVQEQWPSTSD